RSVSHRGGRGRRGGRGGRSGRGRRRGRARDRGRAGRARGDLAGRGRDGRRRRRHRHAQRHRRRLAACAQLVFFDAGGDDRDVVEAAVLVGGRDQPLADGIQVVVGGRDRLDVLVLDHAGQAVGTDDVEIVQR